MTGESLAYLHGARSHVVDDRFAPAITWLWRALELVVAGPAAMLYAQVAVFAAGAYAVLGVVLPARRAAIATALVIVFPPVLVGLVAISTHALAACLLVGAAGALLGRTRRRGLGLA